MQALDIEGHAYPFILVIENEEELVQVYHALNVSTIEYRSALNLYQLWRHVDAACVKRGLHKKE